MHNIYPTTSKLLKKLPSHPSGGPVDQSHSQRDQVTSGGQWDTRKSAESAPHGYRGDGCCRDGPFALSPGVPVPFPVLGPVHPGQEAGERLGVQAAAHAERPGAEAHQEVAIEGSKEGKLSLPTEEGRVGLRLIRVIVLLNLYLLTGNSEQTASWNWGEVQVITLYTTQQISCFDLMIQGFSDNQSILTYLSAPRHKS